MRKMLLLAGLAAAMPAHAQSLDVAAVKPLIERSVAAQSSSLESLVKTLHQNPELSFEERKSAARLAKEMRTLGFIVTEGIGKTGVVAVLKNGEGPTILVRTDMDALPMEEKSGLPYASRVTAQWKGKTSPVSHSCGHDFHMGIWVGVARTLAGMKDEWKGTLLFLAQPAEEAMTGADAMIADGLFTRFPKPDAMLALHLLPLPAGTVAYRSGPTLAAGAGLKITFKGRGGATHSPHLAIDPILMASRFVVDVQTAINGQREPGSTGVVAFGSIHGGSALNIIPDEVVLLGTARSFDDKTQASLLDVVNRTARATALMANAPDPLVELVLNGGVLINDPALVERVVPVFKQAFGVRAIEIPPVPAGEDFSNFGAWGGSTPLMFFFIGAYDPAFIAAETQAGRKVPGNHSPQWAPELKSTIATGVEAMSLAVLELARN